MGEARFYLDQKKHGWFGAGGGTRLSTGYAPDFRVVAVIGYSFPIADTDPPSPGKRFKAERFADHGADRDHDHIPDDIDLCPDEPEDGKPPNPDDGCPALPDRDGDGIPDNVDKCPDQPEDFDGIQDADGCPEDDADKDGIPDAQDACPKEPGEPDPDPKKNGCPKFIRRISGSTEIQILKVIEFATGKATILPKSFPILDEVVRLLKVNLDIKSLGIEGHTDNRGSDPAQREALRRPRPLRDEVPRRARRRRRPAHRPGLRPQAPHRRQQHQRRPPAQPPRRVPHQGHLGPGDASRSLVVRQHGGSAPDPPTPQGGSAPISLIPRLLLFTIEGPTRRSARERRGGARRPCGWGRRAGAHVCSFVGLRIMLVVAMR